MTPPSQAPRLGIVLIGRNEGERLRGCLESVRPHGGATVYVDSGSTDGSIALARGLGADVVELSAEQPFTAARARNAGLERLIRNDAGVELVQFVDGDCRVQEGWLEAASAVLRDRPEVAVVCGRRREAHPEASIYNRLCDMEWDTPVGEAKACGGDAMMRVDALRRVGGFNPAVIAGEEPELCIRLRAAGWKILRVDAEMTLHDAAITRLSQWWRRNTRTGYGYALGASIHGGPPEFHGVRAVRSMILWAGVLPVAAVAGIWVTRGWSILLLFAVYLAQGVRMVLRNRHSDRRPADVRAMVLFTMLGKFPQLLGVVRFWIDRARGIRGGIIEYKGGPTPTSTAKASVP